MSNKDKLKQEQLDQEPAQSLEQQPDQEPDQELEQQPEQEPAKEPKKAIEGATEVKLEKPIENTIILKANEKLSAAAYLLLEDRVARLNAEWEGELKFVLIPYSVDIQE